MGIFTRFKDIVSANINAMLDKAEDPEKMIRLMIREIEETLVELKASCAGHMAGRTKLERDLSSLRDKAETWQRRAELAVRKGRDDLAREALLERKHLEHQLDVLGHDLGTADQLVTQCQEDITLLEDKLQAARDKQRSLAKRHDRAKERTWCRREARRVEHHDAWRRFEAFEQRVDQLEAEAELEGTSSGGHLEKTFRDLQQDEDVEQELARLKADRDPAG